MLVLITASILIAHPAGAQVPALEYLRFSPVAIFGDGVDEMSIEVRVSGSVESVRARDPLGRLQVDGEELGINGEFELTQIASDIWGRSGLSSTRDDDFGSLVILVEDSGGGQHALESFAANFYVVEPHHRREITELESGVQMTDHVLNINDDSGVLIDVGSSTSATSVDIREVSRAFYEHMPDGFEFLSIFTGMTVPRGYFHAQVSNSIEGIGLGPLDFTADFGSEGRLRGVNYLGLSAGGPLLHESTHNVGVFLDPALGLDDGSPHWGAVDIPGFVFGLDFVELDGGDYLINWTRFGGVNPEDSLNRRFPPMELYLWGLAPASEVPAVTVLQGVDPNSVVAGDVVSPNSVSTVTIEDVIQAQGARSPSFSEAPKSFHMAGVLVTSNRLASDAEMALWSRVMEHFGSEQGSDLLSWGSFGSSFHFATEGRGRMLTELNRLFQDRFEGAE